MLSIWLCHCFLLLKIISNYLADTFQAYEVEQIITRGVIGEAYYFLMDLSLESLNSNDQTHLNNSFNYPISQSDLASSILLHILPCPSLPYLTLPYPTLPYHTLFTMIPLFRKHRDKRKDGTGRTSSIQHDQRCNRRRSKGLAVCPSSNFLAALLVPLLMFLTLSALLPTAVNAAEDSSDLSENARGNDESRLLSNLVFEKDSGANTDTDDLFYFSMSADRIQSNMDEDTVSRTHGSVSIII